MKHLWQWLQHWVFSDMMQQAFALDLEIFCHSFLQILSSTVRLDGDRRLTAIFRSLQRCSIWFWQSLKDIYRLVPKPLLCCLGCVLWNTEVLSTLDQVFIKYIAVLCSVQLSLNPDQSPSPCHWKIPPKHDAATTMLHPWDGIGRMSDDWFLPDMTLRIEAQQFSLGFILFLSLKVL